MHTSSFENMKYFVSKYLNRSQKATIADIGSQCVDLDKDNSYRLLFTGQPNWKYVGCDIAEGNNVDVVLHNPYRWKMLKSASFDVMISGQAFEHIEYFWGTMSEISRVLKEGGLCCIVAPSNGMRHRYPLDCWRFYEDGFSALARYAGLEVLEVFTQRTGLDSPHYDPIWQDSVLICQKPVLTTRQRITYSYRYTLNRLLLSAIPPRSAYPVEAQLYCDIDGYNEQDSFIKDCTINGTSYHVQFDLKNCPNRDRIRSIRFDPARQPINLKLSSIKAVLSNGTGIDLRISSSNADRTEQNTLFFSHHDPNIEFHAVDHKMVNFIVVDGDILS